MNFLKRLFGGGSQPNQDNGIYFYVRCKNCRRVLHTRLHPGNDLSAGEEGGYEVRKEMMDDRCFRRIILIARFDDNRRLITQELEGGDFIDKDTWLAEKDLPRLPPTE
jgi:hypothetical protein